MQHLSIERKLKDTTINRKLIVLKMFFDYLYQQNHIKRNYFSKHNFKFKRERKLPKTITTKEVSKLLNYASNRASQSASSFDIWKSARNLALIDILISTGSKNSRSVRYFVRCSDYAGACYFNSWKRAKAKTYLYFLSANMEQSHKLAENRKDKTCAY